MSDSTTRDYDAFLKGPGFYDEGIAGFVQAVKEAEANQEGLEVSLTAREVIYLEMVLRRGEQALEVIRDLSVQTWKLPGMPQLVKLRRDETLWANYCSLRAGGFSGDGRVQLRLDDEKLAGRPPEECTEDYELSGPQSPEEAIAVLTAFYCEKSSDTILKRLSRAMERVGPDPIFEYGLEDLPDARNYSRRKKQ